MNKNVEKKSALLVVALVALIIINALAFSGVSVIAIILLNGVVLLVTVLTVPK
jgi:hypothetical protein